MEPNCHSRSTTTSPTAAADTRLFSVGKQIGNGAFGVVYRGVNNETNVPVAIKTESCQTTHPQLMHEARLYKLLNPHGTAVGLPRVHWYGVEETHNCLVIDLLGPSLEDLFNFCHRRFSLKTVLMLAEQLLTRIEHVHNCGYLHRDIKPENFLIGIGKREHIVYAIDFGLAKRFQDPVTGQHIDRREGKGLVGTARYSSIHTHAGVEQSRRDDLEAIGYMLVYFLQGRLPWQGLASATKEERIRNIGRVKQTLPLSKLCRGLPPEFEEYLSYSRSLAFTEKPSYSDLRALFRNLFNREHFQMDYVYDWTEKLLLRRGVASPTSGCKTTAAPAQQNSPQADGGCLVAMPTAATASPPKEANNSAAVSRLREKVLAAAN